jgi:hypothetical protein
MQFAMMSATDGDRVFVAYLSSKRARLSETKMVGFSRRAAAHEAGLAGHEFGVLLVAEANSLARDSTADGADFLGDFCKGAYAVFDIKVRVWLRSDLAVLARRLLRFLVGKRFQLGLEAAFDSLPVGLRQ